MSDRSLFAVLLRSPWWVSFAVAGAVGLACYHLFPAAYSAVGAVSGLPFAVIGVIAFVKQWGKPSAARLDATLHAVAAMPARELVDALEAAYRREGYSVTRLTANGAELAISKAGRTALVSSRRWKAATHGVERLRELASTMNANDAGQGIYVALNAPGSAAREFASRNGIRVLQGHELAMLVMDAVRAKA
ncbi:MAG: restriction endonuclease [Burkholderiales bacterium]|nr:restriction endonuclease [Burkholderiales bacterium]